MHKIFIAHSDPKLINLYHPYLKRHFSLDSAQDGLMAMRKIRLIQPRLIISDYHLPLLSGLGLLKFIRSRSELQHIPFLFLTDHFDPSLALSEGANDWISRQSATPDILISKIYHHIKYAIQINRT